MLQNDGGKGRDEPQEAALAELFRAIANGDWATVERALEEAPALARSAAASGATRQDPKPSFYESIAHYAFAGDTALHIAAAAYAVPVAKELVSRGANVRAANRRGAEPLHYATDGGPGSPHWNPTAQAAVIELLLQAGADPNTPDKDGTQPLHRAVRTRCAEAVRTLLAGGAKPAARNKAGSTPLHLAVQNTGRGGTGSASAQEQQRQIIELLLEHGARASDKDAKGKSVSDCAKSAWIQELLRRTPP